MKIDVKHGYWGIINQIFKSLGVNRTSEFSTRSEDDIGIDCIGFKARSYSSLVIRLDGIKLKAGYSPTIIRKVMVKNFEIDESKLKSKYEEVKLLLSAQRSRDDELELAKKAKIDREQEIKSKFQDINFSQFKLVGDKIKVAFEAYVDFNELVEIVENMRADNSPLIR